MLTDVLLEEFREAHGHETGRREADDPLNQAENPLSLLVGVHPVMLTARARDDEGDLVEQHPSWRSPAISFQAGGLSSREGKRAAPSFIHARRARVARQSSSL